jgi:hypothetical protein
MMLHGAGLIPDGRGFFRNDPIFRQSSINNAIPTNFLAPSATPSSVLSLPEKLSFVMPPVINALDLNPY